MEIIKCNSYEEMSKKVGVGIENQFEKNPTSVLGLATGSTPIGLYQYLSNSKVDFSKTFSFNLDEYMDLPFNHPQSYEHFMEENLFAYKQFRKSYFPSEKNYRNYDVMIQRFPIDIQILGIGTNGHIAFNEPGTSKDSLTHVVDLTENTIKDNSRFFDSIKDVPKQAITMGIKSIMSAKKIYLLANGKHKKEILEKSVYGEITSEIPASFLQEHKNTEVLYCE